MEAQEVLGLLLTLTAICSYINYRLIKLPKSIGITLVALAITVMINILSFFNPAISSFSRSLLDNIGFQETFLHGMLSFLLFAGALHINAIELSKNKLLITAFATISVLISTILIAYASFWITSFVGINLPFYYCLAFGALISPTDAVTVLTVLKTVKIPKALEMKIAGEALFNDGMGIALFFMALALAYGEEKSIESGTAILYFIREGVGGLVVGAIMGWIAAKLLKTINDSELSIILTLTLVTAGYVLATSVLDVSGPICMVTIGLIVGTSFKHDNAKRNQRTADFWDLLDQLLNAILFVLIGLEFISINLEWRYDIASLGIVIASLIARWISIFVPVITLGEYKNFNPAVMSIMTWGGVRGGISIALALSIVGQPRDFILTVTYFVVLFSIIVQGLTLGPLAKIMRRQISPST